MLVREVPEEEPVASIPEVEIADLSCRWHLVVRLQSDEPTEVGERRGATDGDRGGDVDRNRNGQVHPCVLGLRDDDCSPAAILDGVRRPRVLELDLRSGAVDE